MTNYSHWLEGMTLGPLPGDVPKWKRITDQICRNSHWYAYWRLVDKARKRDQSTKLHYKDGHYHHVLPACLLKMGRKEKTELIWLTHLEHFEAHILLVHICRDSSLLDKMLRALSMATRGRSFQCSKRQVNTIHKAAKLAIGIATRASWLDPKLREKRINGIRLAYINGPSEEHRKKLSAASKGKKKSKLHCEALSLAHLGKPRPDLKGRTVSKKVRKKISLALKGRKRSPEAIAKHRKTLKRPEVHARLSATHKARWANPEFRKQGLARLKTATETRWSRPGASNRAITTMKSNWKDPKYRKKLLAKRKIQFTPEVRKKLSDTIKLAQQSPEVRAKHRINSTAMWKDPKYRKKHKFAMKKANQQPKTRKKRRDAANKRRGSNGTFVKMNLFKLSNNRISH